MFKLLFPAVIVVIFAQLPQVSDFFYWDKHLILQGQVWRLITGNFSHTNFPHLIINIAAFSIFCFIFKDLLNRKKLYLLLLVISLLTGFLLLFSPIQSYAGLSGVLHGLFVWAAIEDIKQHRNIGWLLLLGIWVKIIWEQYVGTSEFTSSLINAKIATDAHFYGALSGGIYQLTSYMLALIKASDAPK